MKENDNLVWEKARTIIPNSNSPCAQLELGSKTTSSSGPPSILPRPLFPDHRSPCTVAGIIGVPSGEVRWPSRNRRGTIVEAVVSTNEASSGSFPLFLLDSAQERM